LLLHANSCVIGNNAGHVDGIAVDDGLAVPGAGLNSVNGHDGLPV
jgi:hypothetical protein